VTSKSSEESLPAYEARMNQGVAVGENAFADLPRLPGRIADVERHVDHDGSADDVVARDASPKAAVEGIAAIVAESQVAIWGNFVGKPQDFTRAIRRDVVRGCGLGGAGGVRLNEAEAVDPHRAVADVHGFTRKADDTLDVVRRIRRKG